MKYPKGKNPNSRNGFKKGVKFSEEHRKKLSESHKGNESYWKNKKRPEVKKWLHNPLVIEKSAKSRKGKLYHIQTLETKMKNRDAHLGEKAYNYIKDRSILVKSEKKHLDYSYKEWVKFIKNRDLWKCRLSNSACKGRLEAHHIFNWVEYPELRYLINNGITLCQFHHPRGRDKEKRMIPIFQELLSVSKE